MSLFANNFAEIYINMRSMVYVWRMSMISAWDTIYRESVSYADLFFN